MRLFNAIFGVFALLAGLYCLLWSAMPVYHAGWFVAFLVGIRGICALITYGTDLPKGIVARRLLITGIIGIGLGIVAIVFSCMPLMDQLGFAIFMLILFIAFLIIDGIASIVSASSLKKQEGKRWKLRMVLGIITLVLGACGAIIPPLTGFAFVNMTGLTLFIYGLVLLAFVFDMDETVDQSDIW